MDIFSSLIILESLHCLNRLNGWNWHDGANGGGWRGRSKLRRGPGGDDLGDLGSLPVRLHQVPHLGEVHGLGLKATRELAAQSVNRIKGDVDAFEYLFLCRQVSINLSECARFVVKRESSDLILSKDISRIVV